MSLLVPRPLQQTGFWSFLGAKRLLPCVWNSLTATHIQLLPENHTACLMLPTPSRSQAEWPDRTVVCAVAPGREAEHGGCLRLR